RRDLCIEFPRTHVRLMPAVVRNHAPIGLGRRLGDLQDDPALVRSARSDAHADNLGHWGSDHVPARFRQPLIASDATRRYPPLTPSAPSPPQSTAASAPA